MDRETFAASVQSRQDALFRVAFSILQNREDALVQPLDVEIEFALLRAVSEGDAPDLEAFATLSKNITVAVTLATLDLAPDKPIFFRTAKPRSPASPSLPCPPGWISRSFRISTRRKPPKSWPKPTGDIALCGADGQPVSYLDMDWLSSDSLQVECRDGQCAYSVDRPGLADTPDALCLHMEGDSDAAKAFNEKMAFPTKQDNPSSST